MRTTLLRSTLAAVLAAVALPAAAESAHYALDATVFPQTPSPNDAFGWSMGLDGDTMVVSRVDFTPSDGVDRNEIFVYRKRDGAWLQEAQLRPADTPAIDIESARVAVSGARIVVGAPSRDADVPGRAIVFERDADGQWQQRAVLRSTQPGVVTGFGGSVALDRNTLVVGSTTELVDGDMAGAAHVFQRGVHGWRHAARLTAPSGEPRIGAFGNAVAIDASRIVVGAPYSESASGRDSAGAAYVYDRNTGGSGAWGLIDRFTSPTPDEADFCGSAVAVSGQRVAVVCETPGEAWVFHARSATPAAHIVDPDGVRVHNFGMRIAFMNGGDRLVIGAPNAAVDAVSTAFVYGCPDLKPMQCTLDARLASSSPGDGLGWDVAIDANGTIAASAIRDATLAERGGAVFVFTDAGS